MSDSTDGLPPGQRGRAMVTIAIAISVAVLDSAIANIALPTIARDLHVSPAESVWVVNAYQIAVTMALLPFSSLGDIYGYKRVYTTGLAVFILASGGCALSRSLPVLIAARLVQGLGAAGLLSVNSALVRHIFPRAKLGTGLGYNSLIVSTCSAIGPSVAAGILSVAPWPYLFAVNLPLGLIALAMNGALPRSAPAKHRFDIPSALLNAATLGLFIAALDGLAHGQAHAGSVAELAGSLAVGVVFVRRQLGLAAPMLPVDLMRRPVFALSVVTSVCSFMAQALAFVGLPFLFEAGMGFSAIETGLLITPWPLTTAIMAPIAGRLSDRFPAGLLGGIGLALMAAGLLSLGLLPAQPLWWDVAWRMALSGFGFAMFQSPNNRLLLGSVPRERSGAGSGMLSTARLLGQTTGAALVAVIFSATVVSGAGAGARTAILTGAALAGIGAAMSSLRMVRQARD